jgi:D-psicose/D-tagatose/L-ribulose 3-epimerase
MTRPLAIAVSTFVWHSPIDDERLAALVPRLAEWGFDAAELPLEQPGDWDPDAAGELFAEHGLGSSVCVVFGEGRELAASDPATIASTQDYVRTCVDVAARQGARVVVGPIYTSVGRTWRTSSDERRAVLEELRESLRPLADYAGEHGIKLGIEPLNRYETSLLNTVEQTLEAIGGLPSESVGVNLDTYHQNIEEKDIPGAIRLAGDRLVHLHTCANDRGAPGQDHLDWTGIREALADVGFTGMLGIESFTPDNDVIATAASIWRPLAPSPDDLARDGLRFLQRWREAWPAP